MLDGLPDDHELEEQRIVKHRIMDGAFLPGACRVSEDGLHRALEIS